MRSPVRAYLGMSLDGYIAGPDDDLTWLDEAAGEDAGQAGDVGEAGEPTDDPGFTAFLAETAAMLMGRRTYDVVAAMDVPWPYDDKPVYVATHRDLTPAQPSVHAIAGTPAEMIARIVAEHPGPVYADGGRLVSALLQAGLLDELTVTVLPVVLGGGVALFGPSTGRHSLDLLDSRTVGAGMVQLHYRVRGTAAPSG